jgi:glycosyltransferase involved in cell wall biosynthesis
MNREPITVVICTKDRPSDLLLAVRSVLNNARRDLKLIVVDQSASDSSELALTVLGFDSRLQYVRCADDGLSRARNLGLELASSEFVLFTDDDCEVPCDWVDELQSELQEHPKVALAFCSVSAAVVDPSVGFLATFECVRPRLLKSVADLESDRGIGAGLGVRRSFVLDLGGFQDEPAGGTFPASEAWELATRALLRGYEVSETNRTAVLHQEPFSQFADEPVALSA